MAARLFGVETEYALTALDRHGAAVERQELLLELLQLARERLVHLPDRMMGVFVASGRLYIDAGQHPEFSTAECTHPDEVVRYVRAGDRILRELADAVVERRRDLAEVVVLRSNVDYGGSQTTWGSHESYLHRVDPARLPRQIIPHLVSRLVYTGAGGFNSRCADGLEFTLSPRVWHLASAISNQSTASRGIFHTKDESLSASGYHRLHLICGESLCSDTALWLRIGTTALVVALVEAGVEAGEGVQLSNPLAAMQRFASDPTCRASAETERGEPMTALAIQRHYLALARRHARHELMPPWAGDVCDRWGTLLDRLAAGPDAVAAQLDWAIKLALYRQHAERRGLAWESLPQGRVARGVQDSPSQLQLALPIEPALRAAGTVEAPAAAEPVVGAPDRAAFTRLREELFEIDMRFGQLGANGICASLDRAGALTHRLVEPADVTRALAEPPATGRAFVRGMEIQRLHARGGAYFCDWGGIVNRRARRLLDLSDPFATHARWTKCQAVDPDMPIWTDRAQALHDQGMALYREARYEDALRLFLQAASIPSASSPTEWSRFWAATVLHNTGRLAEAGALLEGLVSRPSPDDLLYMALTRRALITIEIPSPLSDIERAVETAELRMAARGHADWRSRLLLVRARLLEARGLYGAALTTAVEALERGRIEPNSIATPTHMRTVLVLCLRCNQLARAATLIDEWSSWNTDYQRRAEIVLACGRSELARARGDAAEAVRWAERADQFEEAHGDRAIRAMASEALARALLCAGDFPRARTALRPRRRLRDAEAGADRYSAWLLWADYQLARAQHSAGLPIVDPVRNLPFQPAPAPCPALTVSLRWLRVAQRSYGRALDEGRRLDALLTCNAREREIAGRQAIVEATRQRIAERYGGERPAAARL